MKNEMEMEMEERENKECSEEESGVDEEDEVVMSEVHLGCPPHTHASITSYYTFSLPLNKSELIRYKRDVCAEGESKFPHHLVDVDEDGDLILPRRSKQTLDVACVSIQHNITSTIPNVGLQVWRAELILADYVLHNMFSSSIFDGVIAIELGAGTGLVGILIARVAEAVFITDHGIGVLNNCATNVHVNSSMFRNKSSVKVRELDWLNPWPPNEKSQTRYSWEPSEVEIASKASVLLAADVIYSDELTDAFFSILKKLISQDSRKVLYLALEKRYNFSMNDLDVVANGYSHFLSYLTDKNGLTGKCIDLSDIPQYVREYERGNDVELWEIKYKA